VCRPFLPKTMSTLTGAAASSVTGAKNAHGSTTVHFGGDPQRTNHLPITAGWNCVARLYRPRRELPDGTWTLPEAEPAG
jgi:hypothetical protein